VRQHQLCRKQDVVVLLTSDSDVRRPPRHEEQMPMEWTAQLVGEKAG
jgi:hypothetical protein